MKIAVISDSHDNLANVQKTLDILKKKRIKTLLHCGDICASSTLAEILKRFLGKVHIVFGNADNEYFKITDPPFTNVERLKIWGEFGEIKVNKKRIAFVHQPELAERLTATQKYDLIFYGHTHKPWLEKIGRTELVNPGNLSGLFYRATFATYDTKIDKLELNILR